MNQKQRQQYLQIVSRYVPMWSVTGPGLGDRLYKHFSGVRAERRARLFADRLGPGHRVTPGMGDRGGWISMERWAELQTEIQGTQRASSAGTPIDEGILS